MGAEFGSEIGAGIGAALGAALGAGVVGIQGPADGVFGLKGWPITTW